MSAIILEIQIASSIEKIHLGMRTFEEIVGHVGFAVLSPDSIPM